MSPDELAAEFEKERVATKNELIAAIESEQLSLLREANISAGHLEGILASFRECVQKSRAFPTHLSDLQGYAVKLGLLAARHAALAKIKEEMSR